MESLFFVIKWLEQNTFLTTEIFRIIRLSVENALILPNSLKCRKGNV
jgi:hypothetical protein